MAHVPVSATIPGMLPHLVNFLRSCLHTFTSAIGTNPLGFALMVLDSLASIGWSLFRILRREGVAAMREHWKQTAWITLQTVLWVTLILYGPVAIYSVVRTVYDAHEVLVAVNAKLAEENKSLRSQLNDSNNNAEQRCEQAKGREIAGLRKRLGEVCYLPDRRLTEENRDVLFHVLKRIKAANVTLANINICVESPGDFDSINFALQIEKVFRDAEWNVAPCDPETVKALTKTYIWRGLVVIDSQRQSYTSMELQNNFLQMGIDVQPFHQEVSLPDKFKGTMLLVGFKVGYQPS